MQVKGQVIKCIGGVNSFVDRDVHVGTGYYLDTLPSCECHVGVTLAGLCM